MGPGRTVSTIRARRCGLRLQLLAAGIALFPGAGRCVAPPAAAAAADEGFPRSALEIRAAGGRQWFSIRIADTEPRQVLGLMYVTRLPADEGMLFPQSTPRIETMWMKNTLIPLDMLFIDTHGRILCLLENTKPESLDILRCDKPVKAVLEIGGGEARKRGIRVGDRVLHALFRP